MEINFESIIFYLLLIDSIGGVLLAYSGGQAWWQRNFTVIARHLPMSRGWTALYLAIVLLLGFILLRNNLLWLPF